MALPIFVEEIRDEAIKCHCCGSTLLPAIFVMRTGRRGCGRPGGGVASQETIGRPGTSRTVAGAALKRRGEHHADRRCSGPHLVTRYAVRAAGRSRDAVEDCLKEMEEGGVDAAVLYPPGWDANDIEVAAEAARQYPNRAAISWRDLELVMGRAVCNWIDGKLSR